MTQPLVVVVDSRIWLPVGGYSKTLLSALRSKFTYTNPDFHKKKAMGFNTWGTPRQIQTIIEKEDALGKRWTLPRGGIGKLREICSELEIPIRYVSRMTTSPVEWPEYQGPGLRDYQTDAVEACLGRVQGVVRAPTGSGKTVATLAFLSRAGERAVVIVRDGNLLNQWVDVAQKVAGLDEREIGIVRGGRNYRPGPRLTLALQQSLNAKGGNLDRLLREVPFGAVVVDEVQLLAARTFVDVIDRFPCKYRIGFSADETRKDKKEFLIYDQIGPVICEIDRKELEHRKVIHPVTVRVVETEFRADWYRGAEAAEKDYSRLIEEMCEDEERNNLILEVVKELHDGGETPFLVFTHRREHAHDLADRQLSVTMGIPCGLFLGGDGADRLRFKIERERIETGYRKVAVGTFNALGVGIDLPVVEAGVVATPISGGNRQYFGQVRGRICRVAEGKSEARIYYLWDRHVFPGQLRNLLEWNDGRVEVRAPDGSWVRATARGR